MPTYDYRCAACAHRFEVIHGVHADGPDACPSCGHSPVSKAFVAPTIHFKGSGWAKRDRAVSRTKSSAGASGAGGADADSGGGSGADGESGSESSSKEAAPKSASPKKDGASEASAGSTASSTGTTGSD